MASETVYGHEGHDVEPLRGLEEDAPASRWMCRTCGTAIFVVKTKEPVELSDRERRLDEEFEREGIVVVGLRGAGKREHVMQTVTSASTQQNRINHGPAGCAWGVAIEAAHGKRDLPALPEGWHRVFDSHLDCAPAYSIFRPLEDWEVKHNANRKDGERIYTGEHFIAHADDVSVEYGHVRGEDFRVAAQVAADDAKWLADYAGTCCCDHDCSGDGEPEP